MDITKYINKINDSLSLTYGQKHTIITQTDIDNCLDRADLLSVSADSKTIKGEKQGYLTGILYLAPADLSGFNVCPKASNGCKKACLFSAGRGRFYSVTKARLVKTLAFLSSVERFTQALDKSIAKVIRKARRLGLMPVIRLNGTSDLLVERIFRELFLKYSDVQFYDYTKQVFRFRAKLPDNYHLTFSRSETNESESIQVLNTGNNVAVVFQTGKLPLTYLGFPVVSGDDSDLRFLDQKGVVIGLTAKGQARKDNSGFVISTI